MTFRKSPTLTQNCLRTMSDDTTPSSLRTLMTTKMRRNSLQHKLVIKLGVKRNRAIVRLHKAKALVQLAGRVTCMNCKSTPNKNWLGWTKESWWLTLPFSMSG